MEIGLGVGTAAADDADGMAPGGEAAGQVGEELAGSRGVGVEDAHGGRADLYIVRVSLADRSDQQTCGTRLLSLH